MSYYCYFIISGKNTYIGITKNLQNRINCHNGLKGNGAKSTRGRKWCYHTIIGEFKTKGLASRFEWFWKHRQVFSKKKNKWVWIRTKSGIENKMNRLIDLLLDKEWKDVNIYKLPN